MSAPDPIRRLREIVAASASHEILADGPVTPDAELLDLCAEALHLLASAKKLRAEAELLPGEYHYGQPAARRVSAERERLEQESWGMIAQARRGMYRAAKIPAATPAGIYAKALLVRGSVTGAAVLAKTLADDLIACRELRESLWPADAEGGGA